MMRGNKWIRRAFWPVSAAVVIGFLFVMALFLVPGLAEQLEALGSPEKYQPNEYTIMGEYQDRFVVSETLQSSFPDLVYDYQVYNEERRLLVEKRMAQSLGQLKGLYHDQSVTCYQLGDMLLYKRKGDTTFDSASREEIRHFAPEKRQTLDICLGRMTSP